MTDANNEQKVLEWHRADNCSDDVNFSILLYTLKEGNGWRKGQPVMVNDMMIRIENANGSNNDIAAVANTLLEVLNAPSAPAEVEGLADELKALASDARHTDGWNTAEEPLLRAATALTALQARAEKAEAERDAWKANAEVLATKAQQVCDLDDATPHFDDAVEDLEEALAAHAKLMGDV